MEDCNQYTLLIVGSLGGDLTEEEKEKVEEHLVICEKCRHFLESLIIFD